MATMVIAGPSFGVTGERPGGVGALLPSDPKLGRLTTLVLPPRTSTPGTAGEPVGALPAPPGPGVGEIPPWAVESDPTPVPVLPAPEPALVFSVFKPLPGPSPWPMLAPPPEPPRPGLSPPEGDIAIEPLPPLPGIPTFEPGWDEITIPEPLVFPPSLFGGARTEPESPGPPRPTPFRPEPDSPGPEPMDGGGGTTLLASCVPLPEAPEFPELPLRTCFGTCSRTTDRWRRRDNAGCAEG